MSIRKVLYIILVFKFLSITSCCNDEYIIVGVGELNFSSWPTAYWEELDSLTTNQERTDFMLNNNYTLSTDTIVGPFEIFNSMELDVVNVDIRNDLFTNDLLALSCDYNINNDISLSTLKLILDESFLFNNEIVAAGEDLILLDDLIINTYDGSISINFTHEFMKLAMFENKEFTFELSFSLEDGEEFNVSETKMINI